jgi:L-iditol 2-dehydrogenase
MEIIRELTQGRGADVVVEAAGVPQAVPQALEMLRMGGLLVEAGNFSDLGDVSINPHRHLCTKNVRILGVGGEEPGAYAPSMRQMVRYMKHYPLQDFITHKFRLKDVDAAVQKSIEPDSMKVVIDPWDV